MKYSEIEFTETIKIISYLKKLRIYAAAVLILSLMYFGFKMFTHAEKSEHYLLFGFFGIILTGCILVFVRLNYRTVFLYGTSCIISGSIFVFSLIYYRGDTDILFTSIGAITGLLVMRGGIKIAFGKNTQEIFSGHIQGLVSSAENLITSTRNSSPGEKDVIHCTYTDDRDRKLSVKIKFVDDLACFLLGDKYTPFFFSRNSLFLFVQNEDSDMLDASVIVDNSEWLQAQIRREDFKKYEAWKNT
jgi:hypothetical protein